MGCDIHLHTEIRVNGVWHHYSHPHIPRRYGLFCKMAGVRGPIEGITPIDEPRGLPTDLSFTTKLDADQWEGDGHSHSWLMGDEIDELLKWFDNAVTEERKKRNAEEGKEVVSPWFSSEHEFFGYLFGNGWKLYPEERGEAYPECIEAVRAVFWFDN